MANERTLVILKPDAVLSDWEQPILRRYEEAGLRVVECCYYTIKREEVSEFYKEHTGKFFFNGLVLGMSSGPSVFLIIEGENVIERVRKLNGATNPDKAEPGTIRKDFYSAGGVFNTVHGSTSVAEAEREISLIQKWTGELQDSQLELQNP